MNVDMSADSMMGDFAVELSSEEVKEPRIEESLFEPEQDQLTKQQQQQQQKGMSRWSQLLRVSGAAAVVASMSMFIMQSWGAGNDSDRYMLLLTQTVLLAAGGWLTAFYLKENKSGRLFFALALSSVVANMVTLGALLFSRFQWGSALVQYPDAARWVASDMWSLVGIFALAVVVLVPITLFGFKVLARRSAKSLTITYLLTTSLLLIPVRDAVFSSLLAGLGAFIAIAAIMRLGSRDCALRTLEGRFAQMLLFVAPVIILVRSFWLYQVDEFLFFTLASIVYATLRIGAQSFAATANELSSNAVSKRGKEVLALLGLPIALFVAVPFALMVDDLLLANIAVPVCMAVFGLLCYETFQRQNKHRAVSINAAAVMVCFGFAWQLSFYSNYGSAFLLLLAGGCVSWWAHSAQQKFSWYLGLLAVVAAIGFVCIDFVLSIDLSSWKSLAVIGSTAIVIASLTERFGPKIQWRLGQKVGQ